jgi:hypothetical protein
MKDMMPILLIALVAILIINSKDEKSKLIPIKKDTESTAY